MTKRLIDRLLENTGDMALKRRARRIIEELDPKDGDRILDVGCGDGFYLHLLSNLGLDLDLTGCDFDPNALKSAKKNLKGKKVKLIQADLMKKLPFKDKSFDKIVMSEVAEHLPDDVGGLREVYRVLKPGGVLCLSVPNANYPFLWDPVNWVLEHLFGTHIKTGFWAGIWNQHLRLYTPLQIKKVVQKAGFKVGKVESLTQWCLPFNHYLINLGAILLAQDKVSQGTKNQASKFSKQTKKKRGFIKLFFGVSGLVDKLNNKVPLNNPGVGIFLKALK